MKYKKDKNCKPMKLSWKIRSLPLIFLAGAVTGAITLGAIDGAVQGWNYKVFEKLDNVKKRIMSNYEKTRGQYKIVEPNCLESKVEDVNEANDLDFEKDKNIVNKNNYKFQDYRDMQNILYGESANQTSKARKVIVRIILNRVRDSDYPSNISNAIFEKNAFSCIFDKKNKNWRQAIGEIKRNAYEDLIYNKCREDANAVLNGQRLGVLRENEIIAYHDSSIKKPSDKYWDSLEFVFRVDNLLVYAPKK